MYYFLWLLNVLCNTEFLDVQQFVVVFSVTLQCSLLNHSGLDHLVISS